MKRVFLTAVLTALAVSQAFAQDATPSLLRAPEAPRRISVTGKMGRVTLAPRDSLLYTLRWGKGVNATGYKVTVTAVSTPSGSTSGLPSNLSVTDTTVTFTAINFGFDSLVFNASVISTRGTRSSSASTKGWFIVRIPGTPGGIQVDSSAVPPLLVSLPVILIPNSLAVGQSGNACAYYMFANNTVGMRQQDASRCSTDFVSRYTASQRSISFASQAFVNNSCQVWSSSNIGVATVTGDSCTSANRVGGFFIASLPH